MFKQKNIKKRLTKELKERCYQIGIPAVEEPKITWNKTQFTNYTGDLRRRKSILGRADRKNNTINVDLANHRLYDSTMTDIRHTLVHELVHMRWQYQKHGVKFNQLIDRILRGEIFPMRITADVRPLPGNISGRYAGESPVYTLPNGIEYTLKDFSLEGEMLV